jgi:mycoredoxin
VITRAQQHEPVSAPARPIVYGADWCEDTQRSLRHLRRLSVPHAYINIDEDVDALDRAKALNGGHRRTPVIDLGGTVLVEPSNRVLTEALTSHGLLSPDDANDRLAVQNVGDLERAIRTAGGLLLAAGAQAAPPAARWPLRLAGAAIAFTGVTGWCPAYQAQGMTSLNGPADRPNEASRQEWLAPLRAVAPKGEAR